MIYVVLLLSLLLIYRSFRRYDQLLNPFTLEGYYAILFLIIPQICRIIWLGEKNYIWSDIVILTSLLSIYLGASINLKAFKVLSVKNVKVSVVSLCCVAILLISFTIPILLNCGISFTGIRCYYETVVFTKYASFYDIAKKLIEVSVIFLLVKHCKLKWYSIVLILLLVFSGNKFAVLNIIIIMVLFFQEYLQIKVKKIILLAGCAFILLVIFHFATQTRTEGSVWYNAILYFDIYNNQSFLIQKLIEGDHSFYKGEIYFSSLYKYIPRIIWEGKPYNYGFAILNYEFFPEWAKAGYTPSFGLGTSFADFGLVSIIIFGFVAGFIRNFFYRSFLKSNKNNVSFFLYLYTFDVVMLLILFIVVTINHFAERNENSS